MAKTIVSTPSISDAAVLNRTGKTWEDWFSILDAGGARHASHKEIVALLARTYRIGPWWQQMITVEYERGRGIRKKHERPEGFEISVSKTIARPVSVLYRAWTNKSSRARRLAKTPLTIRKATPQRSLRITWSDNTTTVTVNFHSKLSDRCTMVVQHGRLPNARAAARMKVYWSKAFESLQQHVAS